MPKGFWPSNQWNARELQKLDQQLPALKKLYFCFDPEERANFRAWVAKIAALEEVGKEWNLHLAINAQYDEFDEETGAQNHAEDARMTAKDMLTALVAWDEGEEFAPTRCDTTFG